MADASTGEGGQGVQDTKLPPSKRYTRSAWGRGAAECVQRTHVLPVIIGPQMACCNSQWATPGSTAAITSSSRYTSASCSSHFACDLKGKNVCQARPCNQEWVSNLWASGAWAHGAGHMSHMTMSVPRYLTALVTLRLATQSVHQGPLRVNSSIGDSHRPVIIIPDDRTYPARGRYSYECWIVRRAQKKSFWIQMARQSSA